MTQGTDPALGTSATCLWGSADGQPLPKGPRAAGGQELSFSQAAAFGLRAPHPCKPGPCSSGIGESWIGLGWDKP